MAEKRTKRPRDPIALAKLIGDIATGQTADKVDDGKDAATEFARRGGRLGGKARAEALTPAKRSEIAKKAAAARWKPVDKKA